LTGLKTTARLARALGLAAGAVLVACLVLPLTARPAAACSVSLGYPPTINPNQPNMGLGNPCTDGTSITGSVIVAILAIGALAVAAIVVYRRAEASAGPSSPEQAVATYLDAAGLALGTQRTHRQGGSDAHQIL
jgi:hypothetical protein